MNDLYGGGPGVDHGPPCPPKPGPGYVSVASVSLEVMYLTEHHESSLTWPGFTIDWGADNIDCQS